MYVCLYIVAFPRFELSELGLLFSDVEKHMRKQICIGVGKSSFKVVYIEKDIQIMIITVASLIQKNVTMAQCT